MSVAVAALILSVSLILVLIPGWVWRLAWYALLLYVSVFVAYISVLFLLSQYG